MKRANSQEPTADSSHSCFYLNADSDFEASSGSNCRATSAAMLGLALSVSASGVLLADGEASAAIDLQSASTASEALSEFSLSTAASPSERDSAKLKTMFHTVEQGDSLWQIAQDHKVEVQDIKVANRIAPDILLQVGQVLKVPTDSVAEDEQGTILLASSQSDSQASPLVDDRATAHSGAEELLGDGALRRTPSLDVSTADPLEESVAEAPPTIIPVSEITQEDSLRSAGLVSQSDGFRQELTRLEVASAEAQVVEPLPQAIEENLPQVTALAPSNLQSDYRVRPGDTLGKIAQSLGITAEQLIQANSLTNPNVILAGQTLVIPTEARGESVEPSVPIVMAASPSTVQPVVVVGDTRLARLQSTASRKIDAQRIMTRLNGEQSQPLASPASELVSQETVVDPYAASLVNQVESARQRVEVENIGGPAPALSATEADVAVIESSPVINPEFQARQSGEVAEIAIVPTSAEQVNPDLLAAAPLSPEAYFPVGQSQTGQVVSPELPILPDASEYLPDAPARFNGYIWPTRGTLTSGFGWRWGRMHRGVDVAAPVGTPIMAAASGTVERSGWNSGGYGNLVEIRHPDGSMTRYAHNSRLLVRAGQEVRQGQQIAEMGSTGYSTGPHLHFEIHVPNQGTVNPMALLPAR